MTTEPLLDELHAELNYLLRDEEWQHPQGMVSNGPDRAPYLYCHTCGKPCPVLRLTRAVRAAAAGAGQAQLAAIVAALRNR